MCISACHLTKVLILLIKSSVSFVKWLARIRFYLTLATYAVHIDGHMLQFLSCSFSQRSYADASLIPQLRFSHLHPPLIPSHQPVASAAQRDISHDWDELCDLTGSALIWNAACDFHILFLNWSHDVQPHKIRHEEVCRLLSCNYRITHCHAGMHLCNRTACVKHENYCDHTHTDNVNVVLIFKWIKLLFHWTDSRCGLITNLCMFSFPLRYLKAHQPLHLTFKSVWRKTLVFWHIPVLYNPCSVWSFYFPVCTVTTSGLSRRHEDTHMHTDQMSIGGE